ncbi:MAG: hypothetical protein M3O71_15220 [Bacteroidota bacterium]|nr:hypothetical protein [Bacteroidota bacterium]
MKKLLFMAAVIIGLSSCSKSNNDVSADTAVQYQFTTSSSSSYTITYTDENNAAVTENFTGISWTKVITTNQGKGFKSAQFTVSSTSYTATNIKGSMQIMVNNKVEIEAPVAFDSARQEFFYKVVVFK